MQFLYRALGILVIILLLTGCSSYMMTLDLPLVFNHEDYKVYGYDGTLEELNEFIQTEIPNVERTQSYSNAAVYLASVGKDEYTITVSRDDLVFKYDYIILINLK